MKYNYFDNKKIHLITISSHLDDTSIKMSTTKFLNSQTQRNLISRKYDASTIMNMTLLINLKFDAYFNKFKIRIDCNNITTDPPTGDAISRSNHLILNLLKLIYFFILNGELCKSRSNYLQINLI